MRWLRTVLMATTVIAAFWGLTGQASAYVYWSEGGEIGRANLDGSDVVAGLVTTPSSSVAVDASQIYWSFGDYGSPGTISAAALTDPGSPRVLIADAGEEPHDLVVGGGHIYWIDGGGSNTSIGRAELPDGSNPEPDFIPDPSVHPTGIAVDSERIYWSEGFVEDNIDSFDFQSQTIDHDSVNATKPTAIAVGGGHIYWYNFLDSAIEGATLSAGKGTSTERIVEGVQVSALAADSEYVYWASGASGAIGRVSPSGAETPQRTLISGLDEPTGLALDSGFSPPSPPPPPPSPPRLPIYTGPTKITKGLLGPGLEGNLQTPKQCVAGGQTFTVKVGVKQKGSRRHKASYSVKKVKFLLGGKTISIDRTKPFEATYPGSPASEKLSVIARISVILRKGHRHGLATRTLKAAVMTCG